MENPALLPQLKLFVIVAPITVAILSLCAGIVWRQRKNSDISSPLLAFLLCSLGVLVFNSLELISRSPEWSVFFSKIMYLFFMPIGGLWFVFALEYSGYGKWLSKLKKVFIFTLPILMLIILFTNDWHHLFWKELHFISSGPFLLFKVDHGPLFFLSVTYTYTAMFAGMVLLFFGSLKMVRIFRMQTFTLLLGAIFPLLFNIIYIFRIFPGLVKDFTPFSFFFSGLCFTISIMRYQIHNILPVARASVIDNLLDGVLLFDWDGRIIDVNPAALHMLNAKQDELIGSGTEKVKSIWSDLYYSLPKELFSDEQHKDMVTFSPVKISLRSKTGTFYYQRDLIPLTIRTRVRGYIIIIKDITQNERLYRNLKHMASTDALTGLLNRREFQLQANQLIDSSNLLNRSYSLAMLDLDHFKSVNDRFGHQAGDQVLMKVAGIIRQNVRDNDLAARYGGEEFVILFIAMNPDSVRKRCEDIIGQISGLADYFSDMFPEISVTASIGVFSISENEKVELDSSIRFADEALYQAKAEGRNRVCKYSKPPA